MVFNDIFEFSIFFVSQHEGSVAIYTDRGTLVLNIQIFSIYCFENSDVSKLKLKPVVFELFRFVY